jgi:hypothetical protein
LAKEKRHSFIRDRPQWDRLRMKKWRFYDVVSSGFLKKEVKVFSSLDVSLAVHGRYCNVVSDGLRY